MTEQTIEFSELEIGDRFTVPKGENHFSWISRKVWVRQNWKKWVDGEYKYNAVSEDGRDDIYFKPYDRVVRLTTNK